MSGDAPPKRARAAGSSWWRSRRLAGSLAEAHRRVAGDAQAPRLLLSLSLFFFLLLHLRHCWQTVLIKKRLDESHARIRRVATYNGAVRVREGGENLPESTELTKDERLTTEHARRARHAVGAIGDTLGLLHIGGEGGGARAKRIRVDVLLLLLGVVGAQAIEIRDELLGDLRRLASESQASRRRFANLPARRPCASPCSANTCAAASCRMRARRRTRTGRSAHSTAHQASRGRRDCASAAACEESRRCRRDRASQARRWRGCGE
jgi:hypothetical protein